MFVELAFLDHFWSLVKEENIARERAKNAIIKDLKETYKEHQKVYLNYTIDRLSKGLASTRPFAQRGFSDCLLAVLKEFEEHFLTKEIVQLLNKHVFSYKATTPKEEKFLKFAYSYALNVLHSAGLTPKLDQVDVELVTKPLIKYVESERLGAQSLIDLAKVYANCKYFIPEKLQSLVKFDKLDSLPCAKILFHLRTFSKHKKSYQEIGIKAISLSEKNMKIIASAMLKDKQDSAPLACVDYLLEEGHFTSFWPIITALLGNSKEPTEDHVAKVRRVFELLVHSLQFKPVDKVDSNCDLFNDDLVKVFLSNRSHVDKVYKHTTWLLNQIVANPGNKTWLASSLSKLMGNCPMIDHGVQRPQNRILIRLLECLGDGEIAPDASYRWISSLLTSFLTGAKLEGFAGLSTKEEDIAEHQEDWTQTRLFILQCLRVALKMLKNKKDEKHWTELLNFLVLVALGSQLPLEECPVPCTGKVITNAWSCIFSTLNADNLLQFRQLFSPHLKSNDPLVRYFFQLQPEKKDQDSPLKDFTEDLFSLRISLCIYGIYNLITGKDFKTDDLLVTVKDLADCASKAKPAKSKKNKTQEDEPTWQLVFVDALVNIMTYPSHMLRNFVTRVFKSFLQAVNAHPETVGNFEQLQMVQLVVEILLQRSSTSRDKPGNNASAAPEEEADENEDDDEMMEFADSQEHSTDDDEEDEDEAVAEEEPVEMDLQTRLASILAQHEFAPEAEAESAELDKALAAAFENSNFNARKGLADQSRQLHELKMRCLDLLIMLMQKTKRGSVLLACFEAIFHMAKASMGVELAAKRANKKPTSWRFIALFGDSVSCQMIADKLHSSLGKLNCERASIDICQLEQSIQGMLEQLAGLRRRPCTQQFTSIAVQLVSQLAKYDGREQFVEKRLRKLLLDHVKETRPMPVLQMFFLELIAKAQLGDLLAETVIGQLDQAQKSNSMFWALNLFNLLSVVLGQVTRAQLADLFMEKLVSLLNTGKEFRKAMFTSIALAKLVLEALNKACRVAEASSVQAGRVRQALRARTGESVKKQIQRMIQLQDSQMCPKEEKLASKKQAKNERRAKRKAKEERTKQFLDLNPEARQEHQLAKKQKKSEPMEVEEEDAVPAKKRKMVTAESEAKKERKRKVDEFKKQRERLMNMDPEEKKRENRKNKQMKNQQAKARCK